MQLMVDEGYFIRVLRKLQDFLGLGKELVAVKIVPFGELINKKGEPRSGEVKGNVIFLALLTDEEEMRRTLIHEFFDYLSVKYNIKPLLDVLNRLLERKDDKIYYAKEVLVEAIVNAFETPEWRKEWKRLRYEGKTVFKVSRVKKMDCGLTLANVMIMGEDYSRYRRAGFRLLTSRKIKVSEEIPVDSLNIFEPFDRSTPDGETLRKLTIPVAKKAELTGPDTWLLEREAHDLLRSEVQECVNLAFQGKDVVWPTGIRHHLLPRKNHGLEEN
jgi:hypothetical protein